MRVAVIGCGSIGSRHAANVAALGHVPIVTDNDEQKLQSFDREMPGVGECTLWTDVAVSNADAVLICTPAGAHAAVARELLALGYAGPLFVEKPLAVSSDDCSIFRHWPNRTTMVGYNLRFHPLLVGAKVEHGPLTLGGTFSIECDMRTWAGASYASVLLECSHEIDAALWMGAPPTVTSAQRSGTRYAITLGDTWRVVIDGSASQYLRRWDGWSETGGFSFVFSSPEQVRSHGDMYLDELAHFLDRAERGEGTRSSFADGLRVLDVCEQAERLSHVE